MVKVDWEHIFNDGAAYEKFYIDYFKKFFNYGKKFTTDNSIIEDAIQEVFMDLWAKKQKLVEVKSFYSYFFSAFRYILTRNIKEHKKMVSNLDMVPEPEFSIDYALIHEEINTELQAKLRTSLESLTPHQREAIFLRFYQNLSYEEVAVVLNISVKATYKIMARSLNALKESMLVGLSICCLISLLKTHLNSWNTNLY